MPGTYKSDAVWHNFKPSDFPTMALGGRRDHPSRAYFYEWLARQARQSAPRLTWCDVGVLSMVDYLNVRRSVDPDLARVDRKSTRLNSSHLVISYAVFCLKK